MQMIACSDHDTTTGPHLLVIPTNTGQHVIAELPHHVRGVVENLLFLSLQKPVAIPVEGSWLFATFCDEDDVGMAAALACALVVEHGVSDLCLLAAHLSDDELSRVCKAVIANGSRYHGKRKSCAEGIARLRIASSQRHEPVVKRFAAIARGVAIARELCLEPPNELTPIRMAERCRDIAADHMTTTILDEDEIARREMGGLLAISRGSAEPARVVVLEHRPRKGEQPLCLVGKGVTFDSGGLALKAKAGMEIMKYDMAGAAAVIGAMQAIASQQLDRNVTAIVGLVENMPGGRAVRPGDVVTMMNGTTVEIVNPDAEGRIILADLLRLAQADYNPNVIVDIGTLTGAVETALGTDLAGLFANDNELAARIEQCADATREAVWRMPLPRQYRTDIQGSVSDLKNMGRAKVGGAIYAALFLEHFVENCAWAHLDIGNTGWWEHMPAAAPQGATGYGVDLLEMLARTIGGKFPA